MNEKELEKYKKLITKALVEVRTLAQQMPHQEACEFVALSLIQLGFSYNQMLKIIAQDSALTLIFSEQKTIN